MNIKTYQLESPRSGNPVANQYEIRVGSKIYFQSYRSIICKIDNGKIYLDSYYWDYSRTTVKYLKLFLSQFLRDPLSVKEIREKIAKKEFKLTNLNK